MNKNFKYILAATFTLFLVSSGAATLEDFSVFWDDWEKFENPIESCESNNCITDDSLSNVKAGSLEAKLDTGDTGYCGVAGLRHDIVVPDSENVGLAISLQKAKLDNWGGFVGVKANDDWLISFSSEGGESRNIDHTDDIWLGDESLYYADISEYAGEDVTFKVVTQDKSQEWCNMGDHEQSINLNGLFIISEIQNGEFTQSGESDWETFGVNQVNCDNSYSCESDEQQPLMTNEIQNGKLILDSGYDESNDPEDGGHCGTYGRDQWVYVPKGDEVELKFEASAKLDEWGGDIGVMFDEEWIFKFNNSRGSGPKTYDMETRSRDVSEHSGEWTKMKIVYQDQSGSYCDNRDHDRRMEVESVDFEVTGDSGNAANVAPTARLNSQRFSGTTISFSAKQTTDPDNGLGSLETRWDWQNDGTWDTQWQNVRQASYTYPEGTSETTAKVKVRDGDGGSDTATTTVSFGDSSGGDDSSDDGGDTGEVTDIEIPANGWRIVNLAEEVQKSKFSGCVGGNGQATAYYGHSETGYIQRSYLSESGTLPSRRYFIQSTSNTPCTVELGGSDGDTGGDDGETNYASAEDEWCQTNGHGEALSSFRDDVDAGCKPVNDISYDPPSGGEIYPASQHSGISCEESDDAYICEE